MKSPVVDNISKFPVFSLLGYFLAPFSCAVRTLKSAIFLKIAKPRIFGSSFSTRDISYSILLREDMEDLLAASQVPD